MPEQLLTPSQITAWLDCAHYVTLKHEVDVGTREAPPNLFGEMAQMLLQKGLDHEQAVLAQYRARGRKVFEVPDWDRGNESFSAWDIDSLRLQAARAVLEAQFKWQPTQKAVQGRMTLALPGMLLLLRVAPWNGTAKVLQDV